METFFEIIWFLCRAGAGWLLLRCLPDISGIGKRMLVHTVCLVVGFLGASAIAQGITTAVSRLFGLSVRDLAGRRLFRIALVTASNLLALLVFWVICLCRREAGIRQGDLKWLALTLLFPLVSFSMLMVVFFIYLGRNDLSQVTFGFCCILELSNILIVVLIGATRHSTRYAQELALLHKQLEIQTESIISLEQSYRSQRQATHDFNNQLQTLHRLLEEGRPDAALEYVRQLQDESSVRIFSVNSHNPIVDAVVQQKCQLAQENGIEVTFQLSDLSQLNMKMNETVVLLSNLLDNAIEGCQRVSGPRHITCRLVLNDGLFLSIRNTSPPVERSGRIFRTTKESKKEHGFGLPTVCRILDSNHAEYTFGWNDGWFEFVADIPNRKESCQ